MLKSVNGEFPATLDELVCAGNPTDLPVDERDTAGEPTGQDPWGKALVYEVVTEVHYDPPPIKNVRVTSSGPDGVMGTGDDISYPSTRSADDR